MPALSRCWPGSYGDPNLHLRIVPAAIMSAADLSFFFPHQGEVAENSQPNSASASTRRRSKQCIPKSQQPTEVPDMVTGQAKF